MPRRRIPKRGSSVDKWIAAHGGREVVMFWLRFTPYGIEPQSMIPALLEKLSPDYPEGYFRRTERWYFNNGMPFDWEWSKIEEDTHRQLEKERQQREGRP